jgi:hypothetical protein
MKVEMNRTGSNESLSLRSVRLIILAGFLTLGGCEDPDKRDFEGILLIKLVDAPAFLEELNIVFRRVEIHRAGFSNDVGWRVVSEDIVHQDILLLRNGISRELVSAVVPEGSYDKIRILFGISSLMRDGVTASVEIPTTMQSGYTIDHPFEVVESRTSGITFDFDASRSVKVNASGRFELHPIIRIQNTDLAGSIIGAVLPDTIQALISTSTILDSVTTRSLGQRGNNSFQLVDVPEGAYAVTISPLDTTYIDTTLTAVNVVRRQKTNLGAVLLRVR